MSARWTFAGFPVRRTTAAAVFRFLNRKLRQRRQTVVFFANANFVVLCKHLRREITAASDILVLNDGLALDAAALLRFGARFPENLNGTDFTPAFLEQLPNSARLFLLGSGPEAVKAAADAFSALPHLEVAGFADGYTVWDDEAGALAKIRQAEPDILLIAMGNPLQEEWILRHRGQIDVPLILAVGALFDFVSGEISRAPPIVRKLRLEWAYRLALEPRRLIGRYTIGIGRFFAAVLLDSSSRDR